MAQSQGGAKRGGSTTTNPENKTKENRDLLVGTKAQVYGTLIAAALLAILGAIVKWVAPVNRLVWPPISSAVSTITRWLSEPVLLHLWSAIVIGLALMVFGAICILVPLVIRQMRASQEPEPTMTEYVTDEFYGLRWRWTWFGNSIHDLDPFCLADDTRLDEDPTGKLNYHCYLDCDTCGKKLKLQDTLDGYREKSGRQIERKMRTGEWLIAVRAERDRRRSLHASHVPP